MATMEVPELLDIMSLPERESWPVRHSYLGLGCLCVIPQQPGPPQVMPDNGVPASPQPSWPGSTHRLAVLSPSACFSLPGTFHLVRHGSVKGRKKGC